jgi:NarL family two-component system response regulator LiaR
MRTPRRILLVEDHALLRESIAALLSKEKDLVLAGQASSANEALAFLEKNAVDVALVDIGLPDIDGIRLTRTIKSRWPDVHVLMLTVHDLEEEIFSAFSSGAEGYCLKSDDPTSLLVGIRAVSLGSLYLDPRIAHIAVRRFGAGKTGEESPLSPRETEVLDLIVEGNANKEICAKLGISMSTTKVHIQNILQKLSVPTRTHAAVEAIRRGLV